MAKAEIASSRLPRGTKPVAQAFLAALETIPEASRSAVAKAAQLMIRDELKARRDRQKAKSLASKTINGRKTGGAGGYKIRPRKLAVNTNPARRGRAGRLDAEA